ncbi:MAG: DUF551 domain-containing protein [Prevotellaceae bacterium]|jgi:hypothetical protein|nr:DUF551 domain-containing protein [Prevotellaceae bacterium]
MKTVKEALDKHLNSMVSDGCIPNYEEDDFNAGNLYGFEQGFIAGVEFAQRWISVEEGLPEFLEVVLVRNKNGFASAGRRGRARFIIDLSDMRDEEVTHWRHIELKITQS